MEHGGLETCLIGLGSNLGDRHETLENAVAKIKATPGVYNVEVSRFRETKPVGGPEGQPSFLNAAMACRTSISPDAMLDHLQAIENEMGRVRQIRWDARTLDLDLLLFGVRRFESERLTIPHPRLATRRFVLDPAVELAGNWLHPELGMTLNSLSARISDPRGACWLVFSATQRGEAEAIASACHTPLGSHPLALKAMGESELNAKLSNAEDSQPWLTLVLAAASSDDRYGQAVKHLMRTAKLGPALYLAAGDPKRAVAEAVAAIRSASGR